MVTSTDSEQELYVAINNRTLFEMAHEHRFNTDAYFEVVCPFCGATYLKGEYRPRVAECVFCAGYAHRAMAVELEVQRIFEQDLDDISLEELESRIRRMASGYWRGEYRTVWRRRKDESDGMGS